MQHATICIVLENDLTNLPISVLFYVEKNFEIGVVKRVLSSLYTRTNVSNHNYADIDIDLLIVNLNTLVKLERLSVNLSKVIPSFMDTVCTLFDITFTAVNKYSFYPSNFCLPPYKNNIIFNAMSLNTFCLQLPLNHVNISTSVTKSLTPNEYKQKLSSIIKAVLQRVELQTE